MLKIPQLYTEKDGKIIEIHRYNLSRKKDCFCPRCKAYVSYRKKANIPHFEYFVPCHICKQDLIVMKPQRWNELINHSTF